MTRTPIIAIALAAALSTSAAAAPCRTYGTGICLTPQQYHEVVANFAFIRRCPSQLEPYAINEMGGDCLGGQSGAPQNYGGGG